MVHAMPTQIKKRLARQPPMPTPHQPILAYDMVVVLWSFELLSSFLAICLCMTGYLCTCPVEERIRCLSLSVCDFSNLRTKHGERESEGEEIDALRSPIWSGLGGILQLPSPVMKRERQKNLTILFGRAPRALTRKIPARTLKTYPLIPLPVVAPFCRIFRLEPQESFENVSSF